MKILFKSTAELKKVIGWLYSSVQFDAIRMDIELATEEIVQYIGKSVYDRAVSHYETPTGENKEVWDDLVSYIQLPVAIFAYKSFSENGDVSHEETGRKVKISGEGEKLPWEWMLDRDDAALIRKGNNATERLISYLESNIDVITEWRDSEQRKEINSLFVKDAETFNDVFPIDNSRRFFLKTLPFNRKVEKDRILPLLGKDRFAILKGKIKESADLDGEEKELISLIQDTVPWYVMAMAVKRLSLSVLPEGVVQKFFSERQTSKATTPATIDLINEAEETFLSDAERCSNRIADFVRRLKGDLEEIQVGPSNNSSNKFFTT